MFAVDEAAAEAIRKAYQERGELAAVVELRRYFPLLEMNEHARSCVQSIAGWRPLTPILPGKRNPRQHASDN